jgi:alpha-glucosidase
MPSWQVAMNELSNHDHSRFLTRTNHKVGRTATLGAEAANQGVNKAVFREAVVMQMTWMGAPTIYYGDEAGVCGFTDPDNRRTYPWGKENKDLLQFHKEAIRIHKEHQVLKTGSLEILYGANNVVSYARIDEDEVVVVVVNHGEAKTNLQIPVWRAEIPKEAELTQLLYSYNEGYNLEEVKFAVDEGMLSIDMGKTSVAILYYNK